MPKNAGYSIKPKLQNGGGDGKGKYKTDNNILGKGWKGTKVGGFLSDLHSDIKTVRSNIKDTLKNKGLFGLGGLSKFKKKENKKFGGTPSGPNVMVNTPQYRGTAPGMYQEK
tara:strand:- start:44 stop:379 length:336 start_codon:yes stop_codon:yes gene_type:complete